MKDNSKELLEGSFVDDELGMGSGFVKDGLSERSIVLEQFRRCAVEGSKVVVSGETNQEEVFINCIRILETMLLPKLQRFPKVKAKNDISDKEINKIESDFAHEKNILFKKCQAQKKLNLDTELSRLELVFERKLVNAYNVKLGAMAFLLDDINWFAERSI